MNQNYKEIVKNCLICGERINLKNNYEIKSRKVCSNTCKNKLLSIRIKEENSIGIYKRLPKIEKKTYGFCISCNKDLSRKNYSGYCRNCFPSKDKIKTSLGISIRKSSKSKEIRKIILCRDDYKCTKCDTRNKELHIHHIRFFKKIYNEFLDKYNNLDFHNMEERKILLSLSVEYEDFWNLKNLMTLCIDCHQLEHPNVNLSRFKV